MATGIQTGIRTGASAPMPTGKGPGGGLGKLLHSWVSLNPKMKFMTIALVGVLIVSGISYLVVTAANKPVSLYQTNLTPGDIQEITATLNRLGIWYKVEASRIMVAPGEQSRTVGLLINYGLPHWSVGGTVDAGGLQPKTEFEKRQQATHDLEATLVDELRQVEFVADARVNIVQADEDTLDSQKKFAKATVLLKLKPGPLPKSGQIQSILNLVATSVPGLNPENIRITDTSARVWNDGQKIGHYSGSSGDTGGGEEEAFSDEHIAIKKAYEKVYKEKVRDALSKMLGADKYTVSVDADIDFTQTKIETTQVGDPGGNGTVVTLSKQDKETYNSNPVDAKKKAQGNAPPQQVGGMMGQSDPNSKTQYEKVKYEQKVESSKVQKTAIIPSNVVKRLTSSVAVDGKHDDAQRAQIASVVKGAMGLNESRGDEVNVVDWAFNFGSNPVATQMEMGPDPTVGWKGPATGVSRSLMLLAMLVPTTILLSILTIFLLKQRRVQVDRQGLVMTMGPGATTSDISDLLSDKIGRSTQTTQTTRVNNTEQLEKLAKEKPTKVAELLKSTWLSDRER